MVSCANTRSCKFSESFSGLSFLQSQRYTAPGTYVAAFHFTIALLAGGPSLITQPPVWYKTEKVKTEKNVEDEELKELLTRPLRESKKAKKAKKKTEEEEEEE
jgi:hypothetical protein